MPRYRITIRRIMIAIAIVAIAVATSVMWSRRTQYLELAHKYSELEHAAQDYPDVIRATKMDRAGNVLLDVSPGKLAYYTRMRTKYERAARYPWLPVEPDQPSRREAQR